MSNQILLKRRQVGEDAPTNLDLSLGELAVNTVTGKLFMKNNDEAVIDLSSVVLKSTYDSSNDRLLINDSFQSTLLLHKGLTYTFGISGNTIYGQQIYFSTTEEDISTQYTTGVTSTDDSLVFQVPLDAPVLYYGLRSRDGNGNLGAVIPDSGGSVLFSFGQTDQSGSLTLGDNNEHSFIWQDSNTVWTTGDSDGLRSGSGKLMLGGISMQSNGANDTITFGSDTTLDNVILDGGTFT